MSCVPKRRSRMIFASAVSLFAAVVNSTDANADAGVDSAMEWVKDSGIRMGGWINGGATFNPGQTTGFNGPVTFGDQANRFQLNQFNIFIERAVVAEGSSWDFGGASISCSVRMPFLRRLMVFQHST